MMVVRRSAGRRRFRRTCSPLAGVALALALWRGGIAVAGDADPAAAETVSVVTEEYRFIPDHLTFRIGVLYRLHLENHGKELHEFTAPRFFAAVEVKNPAELSDGGAEVVLDKGEARDVFFVPREAGRFPLRCADHDFEGMTGEIIVE